MTAGRPRRFELALVAAMFVVSCSGRPNACEVAAASSLRPLLEALLVEFAEDEAPELPVRLVTGATTQLGTQLRHGASFALLLAADERTVTMLIEQTPRAADDRFEFARGRLALWTRDDLATELARQGLRALSAVDGPVAIANPAVAPYGLAAAESLRAVDLLGALHGRIVHGENAAQAAHFAAAGAAAAALLPRSLCVSGPLAERGHIWPVPSELHRPIRHQGLVLASDGPARTVAIAIRDHLRSPAGSRQLIAHGFEVPR